MSSSVRQLNVCFGGSACFKVSLTSGDATTIPQLFEVVRAQWGAEAVDLSGLKLTWEPPSHISLGAIDVSAPEHRGKTVAQLGMWDLDSLEASVEGPGGAAVNYGQLERLEAFYFSELRSSAPTPLMDSLRRLLDSHGPVGSVFSTRGGGDSQVGGLRGTPRMHQKKRMRPTTVDANLVSVRYSADNG